MSAPVVEGMQQVPEAGPSAEEAESEDDFQYEEVEVPR